MTRPPNYPVRWPAVIILLHWMMAAALVAMVTGGLLMKNAANHAAETGNFGVSVLGLPLFDAYQLHKSVGVLLFALVIVRLSARLVSNSPHPPESMGLIERRAAKSAHLMLYVLMVSMPLSGWLLSASSPLDIPTNIFGLFELPHPVAPNANREAMMAIIHEVGGWALITLAIVHLFAALKHHFVNRDQVLSAMLPSLKRKTNKAITHVR